MSSKDRELELAKNDARAEMRSAGDDEDSTVIEQRAAESVKHDSSIPPRGRFLLRLVGLVPERHRWIVIGLILLFVGFVAWLVGPAILAKVGLPL